MSERFRIKMTNSNHCPVCNEGLGLGDRSIQVGNICYKDLCNKYYFKNKMTFELLQVICGKLTDITEKLEEISDKIDNMDKRLEALEEKL